MKCRVCKCTHTEPCNPPCAWAENGLCTNCAAAAVALTAWAESALHPSLARLKTEIDRRSAIINLRTMRATATRAK